MPPEQPEASAPKSSAAYDTTANSDAFWGVGLRLGLSVLLAIGVMFWPYQSRCGFGLFGYVLVLGVVTVSGVWSAIWSWRHRTGRSHVVALLLIVWGVMLLATEMLPRIGYAVPTIERPSAWVCR
jgi:hypothetical protein